MAKNAETVQRLVSPITREKGYMYYLYGEQPKDGKITRVCRSKMAHGKKKEA